MTNENSDIIHGAAAFAKHLNVSLRRAFYLLETEQIPAGKLGDIWVGRKSRLDAHIDDQMAANDGEAA